MKDWDYSAIGAIKFVIRGRPLSPRTQRESPTALYLMALSFELLKRLEGVSVEEVSKVIFSSF